MAGSLVWSRKRGGVFRSGRYLAAFAAIVIVSPAEEVDAQNGHRGIQKRSFQNPPPAAKGRYPQAKWVTKVNAMSESERAARISGYQGHTPAASAQVRVVSAGSRGIFPVPRSASRVADVPQAVRPVIVRAQPYHPVVEVRKAIIEPSTVVRAVGVATEGSTGAAQQRVPAKPVGPIEASPLFPGASQTNVSTVQATAIPARVSLTQSRARVPSSRRLSAFLSDCQALSKRGLKYMFGSNDPKKGGLDCSGTVQHLLQQHNVASVPRQSNLQYHWLEKLGTLKKVGRDISSKSVLGDLTPGDLLFWKDTYDAKRSPNVTHVMIYMGRDSRTGKHMMFGARGSRARGAHGNSVDLFEFRYPFKEGRGKFIGYGSVPDLRA